jgi:hypothetical protein
LQTALDAFDGTLDGERHPVIEAHMLQQAIVLLGGFDASLGDEAEGTGAFQVFGTLLDRTGSPEAAGGFLGLTPDLGLFQELDDDHVPTADAHDQQKQQHGLGDRITAFPQGFDAEVIDLPAGFAASAGAASEPPAQVEAWR